MIFRDINSLEGLQKRKKELLTNIELCESSISDAVQDFMMPFNEILKRDNSIEDDDYITESEYYSQPKFLYNLLKTVKNGKRIFKMFQIGKAVFFDYKKK